jgi:hypothetical protein
MPKAARTFRTIHLHDESESPAVHRAMRSPVCSRAGRGNARLTSVLRKLGGVGLGEEVDDPFGEHPRSVQELVLF